MKMAAVAVVVLCVQHAAAFSAFPLLGAPRAHAAKRACVAGTAVRTVMQLAPDESWNFRRFATTFGFFNGNPLLKLIPFAPKGPPSVRQPTAVAVSDKEVVLWSFEQLDARRFAEMWAPLDDVVMGGVSVSNVQLSGDGAVLLGETSSRNNGGFCSARTRNCDPPFNIADYSALGVRVKCDKGMHYKVILRDEAGWDTIAWCYSFDAKKNQWMDLRAPLEDFIPVVRGNTLRNAPRQLDKSKIYSVQLMISKYEYDGALNPNFQEGPFRLDFGNIRALK